VGGGVGGYGLGLRACGQAGRAVVFVRVEADRAVGDVAGRMKLSTSRLPLRLLVRLLVRVLVLVRLLVLVLVQMRSLSICV
jgi:hypothetical protein